MSRLIFALLIPLAACATPQQKCLSDLTKDARALDILIGETAGNIERGYGLETKAAYSAGLQLCTGRYHHFYFCTATRTTPKETPVAIDVAAERRKLAALKAKRAENRFQRAREVAACNAL